MKEIILSSIAVFTYFLGMLVGYFLRKHTEKYDSRRN